MRPTIVALSTAFILCLQPGSSTARELADAPEVTLLGFSPDGRYFAYEQYENDTVSDTAVAAIDVIDRQTNRSAKGFPFGFLGVSKNQEFPLRVGGHKIKINDALEGEARLAELRAAVRGQTKRRLEALKIGGTQGRRLAGRSINDRTPGDRAPEFVLSPTLPGPIRDLQFVYRVSTEILPKDYDQCVEDSKIQDHRIVVRLDAFQDENSDDERETPKARTQVEVPWMAGDSECAAFARVTDVIDAPGAAGDKEKFVVVVMLAISRSGHAETSRYFATFVPLPKD